MYYFGTETNFHLNLQCFLILFSFQCSLSLFPLGTVGQAALGLIRGKLTVMTHEFFKEVLFTQRTVPQGV